LGNYILQNQKAEGWGAKIIDKLSADLGNEFPDIKGFSARNLKYMRKFALSYPAAVLLKMNEAEVLLKKKASKVQQAVALLQGTDDQSTEIVQQPVAQLGELEFIQTASARISWSHNIILLDKLNNNAERFWYMLNTLEHGNSRDVMAMQIESGLFKRQVASKKVTNFKQTLPAPQTDFAHYIIKDPYIFDFVTEKFTTANWCSGLRVKQSNPKRAKITVAGCR